MKKILTISLCFLISLVITVGNSRLYALSAEQKRVLDSGILYFNVEDCTPGGVATSTTDTLSTAGITEMEEYIFWTLVSKGYTMEQASGVLGNMWIESVGLEPGRVQFGTTNSRGEVSVAGEPSSVADTPASGGYGLVQWTPGTKILPDAQKSGMAPNTAEFQVYLLLEQLEGRSAIPEKSAGDDLKRQTTVADATRSFLNEYERAKSRDPTRRIEEANKVLARFSQKEPPEGITVPASPGSSGGVSCDNQNISGTESIIDGFVIYNQEDPAWANKPYGTSTVAEAGCGPSSVAMIASTLGDRVTPDQVALRFSNLYKEGEGSSWDLMTQGPEAYGLTSIEIGTNMTRAAAELSNGSFIIASGKGPKPFTTGGHILVLRGITASGKILVGDSGHNDTSDQEWDVSQLSGSISNMWVVNK